MKKRAIVVLPLLLALGACGGDDDNSGDGGSSEDGGGGGGDSDWCSFARGVEDDFSELNTLDPNDTATFQELYTGIADRLDDAADDAPDEIRDDVQTLSRGFNTLIDELEKVDFNVFELDEEVFAEMETEMNDAETNIETYNRDVCGIVPAGEDGTEDTSDSTGEDTGDDTSGEPSVGGADAVRDQFEAMGMTEEQANCLIESIDVEEFQRTQDVTQFLAAIEDCDIDFSQLGGG